MGYKAKVEDIDFLKMKYATKFRSILEHEDITASILAGRMGFSRTRMSRILNGIIFPSIQDIETLKKVFPGMDLNEFLSDGIGMQTPKRKKFL
jgi:transcriptional regulator with XRE-family HTH domain